MTAERTFTITFVPRRNVDGVKAVRRLLKYAGRHLGLRVIDAQEHNDAAAVATRLAAVNETPVPLPEGETTS
jgi:hypothetical protein